MQNVEIFQGPGRKVSLLAITRQGALLSQGAGVLLSSGPFSSRPRCALRKASKGDVESDIPPMLAAQSAFPSEPLPGFHKIFNQLIWG